MRLRKKLYEPNLIDLDEYEIEVTRQAEQGIAPRPPRTTTTRADRQWASEEMQAMRENRQAAQRIYEQAKRRQ
jgi:hypothetical protein